MNEDHQQPDTPEPSPTPPPAPKFIGNTNVIDRSNLQNAANLPAPASPSPTSADPPAMDYRDSVASSAFSELLVLILGFASATCYLLIVYLLKKVWLTAIVSAILAFLAIFFAVSAYKRDGKISPLTVVGLSAATITLLYIANILMAEAFLHSLTSGYTF